MNTYSIKRFVALFLALSLALCFSACQEKRRRRGSSWYYNSPGNTTDEPSGGSWDDPSSSDKDLLSDISPLSGLPCTEEIACARPVAVMVNNLKEALPQVGVSEADIVYEVLAEGGITRLLCIYNDYKNIPEIGSVRSARDYFIDLSDAHDAIYVHSGSSTYATKVLNERKTDNIDGFYMGNFTRSPKRAHMAWEHRLVISGEGLTENIQIKGYRTTSESTQPLSFNSRSIAPLAEKANHIEIPFKMYEKAAPYAVSFFDYDEKAASYTKGHFRQPHIDGDDNSTLTFNNILVLECDHAAIPGDELGCISVDFTGTGSGKYFTMGHEVDILWTKDSRTQAYSLFKAENTDPLTLNPGKTYIAIVPTGTALTITK